MKDIWKNIFTLNYYGKGIPILEITSFIKIMQLITEITDKDFDPHYLVHPKMLYTLRRAVRAILLYEGKIAIMNVTKGNYHKLPGGGIQQEETNDQALEREVKEETGCEIEIKGAVGITIECKDKDNEVQISYVYVANVLDKPGNTALTEEEERDGFKLEWRTIEEVKELFNKDTPTKYTDRFISLRDKRILEFYLSRINT